MQAVLARINPQESIESCGIAGCSESAALHLVKMRDDGTEEETFFCETHGDEYARRGHLPVTDTV